MVSERSSLLANLTPEQLLQLQKRLMRQRPQTPRSVILQRPTLSPCPLSSAQQRLWFLHQLAPHSVFYNVARAVRLYGLLSIAVLQRPPKDLQLDVISDVCHNIGKFETHVVIGTPITPRRRIEPEGLVGFFVNTLVFHTHLTGRTSFRELLVRVRQVTVEAFDQSDLPFEQLIEDLQPARTLHYHPLFQVMFNFRSATEEGTNLPIRCLFETPTVAGLAEVIETMQWARQELQPSCETPLSDREEGEI